MPANPIPAAWAVHLPVVVEEVFRTMLGVELVESEGLDEEPAELFTAAIFFAGEWLGALLLECPPAEAFTFTHRFMRVPEPTALTDDVKDTLGELTNMIAGNLKAVMPPGVVLSMPTVVSGRDYSFRICGVSKFSSRWFAGDGVTLRITTVAMGDPKSRRATA